MSRILNKRLLQTYMWHPYDEVEKHLLVSTQKYEGHRPNDYNKQTETMAFPTWDVRTSLKGLLQVSHDDSEGIYEAHSKIIKVYSALGYKRIKTIMAVIPEGENPDILVYTKKAA